METKLKLMKYFLILFLIIVSCKEGEKPQAVKPIIKKEIVEPKVEFYDLFLEHEAKQELYKTDTLDTTKYFKIYVIQGQSKLIDRQFEDIKPSNYINREELNKLNYHNIFENYQSDFIDMYEFNSKKYETNKTEIIYFFTYPFSVAKDKVLIGFEIKSKSHHLKETTKRIYMGFVIFKKTDSKWSVTEQKSFME